MLQLGGPSQSREINAIIDTGFTGELTLPPATIADLALPERTQEEVVLGDGTVRTVQLYAASVRFAGQERDVLVGEAPTTPLLGTELLRGFELTIQFWANGGIEIREAPGLKDL